MAATKLEIVSPTVFHWITKILIAAACMLVFLRLSNLEREARTIEGVNRLSHQGRVKSYLNYEGTNIIELDVPEGLQIEIWYGDNRSAFARPPIDLQVRRFDSVVPVCRESIDPKVRFPKEINFLPYAITTEYRQYLHDFPSMMKNLDKAKEFLRSKYGKGIATPISTTIDGTIYNCFLEPSARQ